MVTANHTSLPKEFETFLPFAEAWALDTEAARAKQRWNSDFSDIEEFYNAVVPELERALDYLNQFDLESLTQEQNNLLNMTLSIAEVAGAVESFRESAVPYAFSPDKFRPVE